MVPNDTSKVLQRYSQLPSQLPRATLRNYPTQLHVRTLCYPTLRYVPLPSHVANNLAVLMYMYVYLRGTVEYRRSTVENLRI